MCGFLGYSGNSFTTSLFQEALSSLASKGCDSSVFYSIHNNVFSIYPLDIHLLDADIKKIPAVQTALASTFWKETTPEKNTAPFVSDCNKLSLVSVGIIQNQNKTPLDDKKNVHSVCQRDEAILVNDIALEYAKSNNLLAALSLVLTRATGSFSFALISREESEVIYAAHCGFPLFLGIGNNEHYISSDLTSLLQLTHDIIFLEKGELVRISKNAWEVFSLTDGTPIKKNIQKIAWDSDTREKNGHAHFMVKEIYEQPQVLLHCMQNRVNATVGSVRIHELEKVKTPTRLRIIACGTSYHAGLWAQPILEAWAKIPSSVEIASEFRYRKPLLDPSESVLVISQSGETADTLAALEIAKQAGCEIIGICNAPESTLTKQADTVIHTHAGPEISVASTKAFSAQMLTLLLMALHWGEDKKLFTTDFQRKILNALLDVSQSLEKDLPAMQSYAKSLAPQYAKYTNMFFLGRGYSYPLALEGALKIKETSYVHAEGYSAGEVKHGPLALIDSHFPSIMLVPHDEFFAKSKSNLEEIRKRGGPVLALTNKQNKAFHLTDCELWEVPESMEILNGFFLIPAMQLLSYEVASHRGNDVDQPRNLSKSVIS